METLINSFSNKKDGRSINLMWVGVGFSVIFWLLEAVQDVLTFEKGDDIFRQIFMPDTMSLWTRILVVCILMLFSVYAQSLKSRLDGTKEEKPRPAKAFGVMASGISFGALYWVLESVRDWFIYSKDNLLHEILFPDVMGFWMRLLAVLIIILFSIYVQNLINERKRIEESLKASRDKLEQIVNERTTELMKTNTLLQRQISERIKMEEELRKANRALKILSQCNEALVRATDENSLLDDICRTIVRTGEFDLAWVGYFHHDDGIRVQPVSRSACSEKYLTMVDYMARSCEFDHCPMGTGLLSGKSIIIKDLLSAGESTAWHSVLHDSGFESMVSLPLRNQNRTFGILTILSQDSVRFSAEETTLLEDLAEDIAFGIMALRTRIERTRTEEEKTKIQAQLLHSQKMEAVGLLAGGVAHDFNNVLTAIQVSTDLAMMQIQDSDPAYLELKEIQHVAAHAGSLAKQLLLFSRKHPMEFGALSYNEVIENLHKMLMRIIGEDIEVETHLEKDLWMIWADRGTLEQVLMNLIINAKDAMPNGGRLTISTENVRVKKASKKSGTEERPGKFVRLTVSDTGIGMDRETLTHIFEPFFSTKGPKKGTGLGLSVVYGIVQEHQGWINVESEMGNGARFEITLPAVFVRSEVESPETIDYSKLKGNGERVLLIEDEVRVREFTTKGLTQNNYQVFPVSTAEDALSLFNKEKGNFDLIFSDVVLPDLSGVELAEQLLSQKPDLRIILSSGYADQKSKWHVVKERGMKFLQKPYALPELLKVLKA